MLSLGRSLAGRGIACDFAFPDPPPGAPNSLASEAGPFGVRSAFPIERARGLRLRRDRAEVSALRQWFVDRRPQIVHCWHTRDHLLALRARRGLLAQSRPCIVRSYRRGEAIPPLPWNRWLFGPGTDGLICVSPGAAERNQRLRRGRPLLGHFGAVDVERFRPAPVDVAMRRALDLAREDAVVGIVARIQRHRRFDLLLAAAERLFARLPEARLLIVGRGTHRETLAARPAAQRGISRRIRFAGYRSGDYTRVLHCIDVFTLLVPGSDGTCRAVLEAQACGLPAVTSRRGALPEIVAHGETGLCVDEDPIALAQAWEEFLHNHARRRRAGRAARHRAEQLWRPEYLAVAVANFYEAVLCSDASSR